MYYSNDTKGLVLMKGQGLSKGQRSRLNAGSKVMTWELRKREECILYLFIFEEEEKNVI